MCKCGGYHLNQGDIWIIELGEEVIHGLTASTEVGKLGQTPLLEEDEGRRAAVSWSQASEAASRRLKKHANELLGHHTSHYSEWKLGSH